MWYLIAILTQVGMFEKRSKFFGGVRNFNRQTHRRTRDELSVLLLAKRLEHEIATRRSRGSGHALRFSVRLIPCRIKIAYGPVHVKALGITM